VLLENVKIEFDGGEDGTADEIGTLWWDTLARESASESERDPASEPASEFEFEWKSEWKSERDKAVVA